MCVTASAFGAFTASAADDLSEPGHDILDPIEVQMNEQFSGTVKETNDWYSFTLPNAAKVNLILGASGGAANYKYYEILV